LKHCLCNGPFNIALKTFMTKAESDTERMLGCIYKSPSSSLHHNSKLCDLLQMTQNDSSYSHILIGGDFNYLEVDWTTWTTSKQVDHHSQTFVDRCIDVYLETLLDLILTSDDQMVQGIKHLPGLGISDHLCLLMNIHVYTQTETDKNKTDYVTTKADTRRLPST